MKSFCFTLLLLVGCAAYAGDKVGNGGDVISCPGMPMILLDLYQGKENWDLEPIERTGARKEILLQNLEKFSLVDPVVAGKILARSIELEQELSSLEKNPLYRSSIVKLTVNTLVNIADEGIAEIPLGCEIIQAATQNQRPFPGEVKFTFQKSVWDQLDTHAQASLILHEVIYEHMISVGEIFSKSTRFINAALHAGNLDTVKGYFTLSSLFLFKNISIELDTTRVFGAKRACLVMRRKFRPANEHFEEGTTIMAGGRYVVTDEKDLLKALMIMRKSANNGICD